MTDKILPGRYRHYKGNEYQVIDVARHSETDELLVVYRCLYGDKGFWVRPLDMFCELVTINSEGVTRQVPRFRLIEPVDDRLVDTDGLT